MQDRERHPRSAGQPTHPVTHHLTETITFVTPFYILYLPRVDRGRIPHADRAVGRWYTNWLLRRRGSQSGVSSIQMSGIATEPRFIWTS